MPGVGRHVTYYGTSRRPRPATITNVDSVTVLDLRVGRSGEVYLNVPKETGTPFSTGTGVWGPLGR